MFIISIKPSELLVALSLQFISKVDTMFEIKLDTAIIELRSLSEFVVVVVVWRTELVAETSSFKVFITLGVSKSSLIASCTLSEESLRTLLKKSLLTVGSF